MVDLTAPTPEDASFSADGLCILGGGGISFPSVGGSVSSADGSTGKN